MRIAADPSELAQVKREIRVYAKACSCLNRLSVPYLNRRLSESEAQPARTGLIPESPAETPPLRVVFYFDQQAAL